MQMIDFANWADKNFPAVREGQALTAENRAKAGEWMASDAYIKYDCCDKLRPSAR
jgi:hypothetical protein